MPESADARVSVHPRSDDLAARKHSNGLGRRPYDADAMLSQFANVTLYCVHDARVVESCPNVGLGRPSTTVSETTLPIDGDPGKLTHLAIIFSHRNQRSLSGGSRTIG
jgi:hypothetical protein